MSYDVLSETLSLYTTTTATLLRVKLYFIFTESSTDWFRCSHNAAPPCVI